MSSKSSQVMMAIEQDIRARGLKPGQLYQSAREVAQSLGVSPMTADRAMRKLASNGLLQRRHGSGTYVGEGVTAALHGPPRTIQIWVPSSFFELYGVIVENIVKTVHLEFPGDTIQQVFLPEDSQVSFCESIVSAWEHGTPPRTVVLVSCNQAVQRLVKSLNLPVVATGGVSKNNCEIPWIDMDYREAGHLLAEYIVSNGHRRVLVLMNRLWGFGDNEFLDGVEQGIARTGVQSVDARVRSVELEQRAIEAHLRRALRASTPPTAVICSSKLTASVAVRVAESLDLRVPDDFLVGTVRVRAPHDGSCKYAYTRWATSRESNAALYSMVHQINQGETPNPNHFLIPVELVAPDALAYWDLDQA
jgi:DNA-binding LacI/PurR family transcriptional regulator